MTQNHPVTPYDDSPYWNFLVTRDELRTAYLRGVSDADELGTTAMQLGYTPDTLLEYARFYMTTAPRLHHSFARFSREIKDLLK